MKLKDAVILLALALLLSICLAAGSPDEAYGRVVKVVDGDTFDVQLQDSAHPGKAGCSHGYPT